VQVIGVCGVVLRPENAVEETAGLVVDAAQESRAFIVAAPMRSDRDAPAVFQHGTCHSQRFGCGVLAALPAFAPIDIAAGEAAVVLNAANVAA
jgi:hypothetical protein